MSQQVLTYRQDLKGAQALLHLLALSSGVVRRDWREWTPEEEQATTMLCRQGLVEYRYLRETVEIRLTPIGYHVAKVIPPI